MLQMIICIDLIAHISFPTWFQNKIWCIIGIELKCISNLPLKLFIGNTQICYNKTPNAYKFIVQF
jgi:hypothetical protein